MKSIFGYHLTLDLYGCTQEICDDLQLAYAFLEDIVKFLKMHKQSPPFVIISDKEKYPDKAGISGWVPLIESSVVIHTLSKKRFISIDIYSCKEFDVKETTLFVKNYFKAEAVEINLIKRGLNYYK